MPVQGQEWEQKYKGRKQEYRSRNRGRSKGGSWRGMTYAIMIFLCDVM
jgi:hypothetical protein